MTRYYDSHRARKPNSIIPELTQRKVSMTRHALVVAAQSNDPATRSWAIEAIAAA
jgi:hypothetical protein